MLDYLVIHKVDPERGREAIAHTSRYLEGVAKEFFRTWRAKLENSIRSLTDFLNDSRAFCVPTNHKDKLWKTFAEVTQTTGNQSRPIQEVAMELQMLKMRVPELSDAELYYQFKNAMKQELRTLVLLHITVDIYWNDIVDMAMKFDEG